MQRVMQDLACLDRPTSTASFTRSHRPEDSNTCVDMPAAWPSDDCTDVPAATNDRPTDRPTRLACKAWRKPRADPSTGMERTQTSSAVEVPTTQNHELL